MAIATTSRAASTAAVKATGRGRSPQAQNNITGWAFAAPFVVLFAVFLIWPIIYGFYLSFTGTSLTGSGSGLVGFANYAEAFKDPAMWRALGNTVTFTLMSTVPLVVISLIMALLVNTGIPGQWLWRLSFFLPFLLASTVVSMIWIWMYNPKLGLINDALMKLGMEKPLAWLQNPDTAMGAVVATTVWWTIGFNFLLYLAALQNIPEHQYEAAQIDGATKWRQLIYITIPQLGQTTALIIMLQILASLKVFDQIYQMTSGGPKGSTRPVVQYIYQVGFTGFRLGYAAAISYIFFAIIVILSVVQNRITSRRAS